MIIFQRNRRVVEAQLAVLPLRMDVYVTRITWCGILYSALLGAVKTQAAFDVFIANTAVTGEESVHCDTAGVVSRFMGSGSNEPKRKSAYTYILIVLRLPSAIT